MGVRRELDVVATVRNLVRSCPRFWSSEELMRSCQAGDWLAFDRDAVAKVRQVAWPPWGQGGGLNSTIVD